MAKKYNLTKIIDKKHISIDSNSAWFGLHSNVNVLTVLNESCSFSKFKMKLVYLKFLISIVVCPMPFSVADEYAYRS